FALGLQAFEDFKKQQIQPPLARTLNRKIALLQQVKKRAEETVAMRQAEPAVCALAQLGEAQMLLAHAIATSPAPGGLNAEERKLYRDALQEKAKPLLDEARETLAGADGRARELGGTGEEADASGGVARRVGTGSPGPGRGAGQRACAPAARGGACGVKGGAARDRCRARPGGALQAGRPGGAAFRSRAARLRGGSRSRRESRTGRSRIPRRGLRRRLPGASLRRRGASRFARR